MKLSKKKSIIGVLIFLLIAGGFVWYNQDLKFRIAEVKLCENDIPFLHQYKKLELGCYDGSYSYGKYSVIWMEKFKDIHNIKGELKDIFLDDSRDLNDDNQDVEYYSHGFRITNKKLGGMEKFKYERGNYLILGFIGRKQCVSILCEEVDDIVDVMIFDKDNLQLLYGGEITIANGNPKKYGKGESVEEKPYEHVSKKNLENIIMLIFQKDAKQI